MEEMTPEQRLDRAERILVRMVKSGRMTRSEWRYKINSLIDAQISHEATWRKESEAINVQLKEVAAAQAKNEAAQAKNEKAIADLTRSQKITDRALRAFIAQASKK